MENTPTVKRRIGQFDIAKMVNLGPIKKELRAEIKSGMIKMFLAGMAAVIIANWFSTYFAGKK